MRIKLLKKMYRQTKEAIKRGDVFQQRPCPFYNEMHRIFSGADDTNSGSFSSHPQSFLNDDDDDVEGEEDIDDQANEEFKAMEQNNESHLSADPRATEDKLSEAIDRMIQYQEQNEVKTRAKNVRLTGLLLARLVGTNTLNNRPISTCNVDRKIEPINFNWFNSWAMWFLKVHLRHHCCNNYSSVNRLRSTSYLCNNTMIIPVEGKNGNPRRNPQTKRRRANCDNRCPRISTPCSLKFTILTIATRPIDLQP